MYLLQSCLLDDIEIQPRFEPGSSKCWLVHDTTCRVAADTMFAGTEVKGALVLNIVNVGTHHAE